MAVLSFKDWRAEALFAGRKPGKGFPADLVRITARKLEHLDAAERLDDLRSPPGNRLKALSGDLAGRHSIRVNRQFRIVFRWVDSGAADVEIVDYHWEVAMAPRDFDPIHPGEILLEDFLKPLGMTPYAAAKRLGVPRTRIERIVRNEAPITSDTALRLERAFGASAEFWMNLQSHYELEVAREKGVDLGFIRPVQQHAAE